MASVCSALCLAAFLAVLVHHHQPRPLLVAAAPTTNHMAGLSMTPPNYITSLSGVFAFGFRALDASNPGKFLLDDDGDGQASSFSQLQSVVLFAKQSSTAALATAQSVLSVTTEGQLELTDITNGGNQVLWRPEIPNLKRGSLFVLLDTGNLQFLGDGGVLWESFSHPRDTLVPGQSLAQGQLISRRADTDFTTGRFSMDVQTDGNVVLYVYVPSGNTARDAYWQTNTDGPNSNTTVTFDDQGGLVQSLISPMAADTASKSYKFARMDPDGIVRSKNAGGNNTSWTVSGSFPTDGCGKRTSGLQGMCGPGSYCTEQKDRLRCMCPADWCQCITPLSPTTSAFILTITPLSPHSHPTVPVHEL
ncbi:hypothetical protein ACQ4PT_008418 [Festuca glaucescens]